MTTDVRPAPTLDAVVWFLRDRPGLAALDLGAGRSLVTWGDGPPLTEVEGWPARARARLRPTAPGAPFSGGLVGWLGYEAGRAVERQPPPISPPPLPEVCLWRVEGALLTDRSGAWQVTGSEAFQAEARAVLAAAVEPEPAVPGPPDAWRPDAATQGRYEDAVRAVLNAIRAGDVYQVNIAWEQRGVPCPDPVRAWLALRRANPARRGALLHQAGAHVVSNSPELYLDVRRRGRGLVARSVPIKGTADPRTGPGAREALLTSEKERAELTMIVDLVRNDLGRVAAAGGVRARPRGLVRCGDLLHAEQPVVARLRRGVDAIDAVAATFPPGSVTGAPKVAAMALIRALEEGPRGVYTGAIGAFADGGEAHWNVAIRTATVRAGQARFHVGAGLVADSDPTREWHETVAKGRALARWLGAR